MALVDEGQSADTIAFMDLAFEQAKLALDSLEVPVGCVITEKGKVISNGRNRTTETRNATRHAEMEAIDALLDQWKKNGLSPTEVAVLKKYTMAVQMINLEAADPYYHCIHLALDHFLVMEKRRGVLNVLEESWLQKQFLF